METGGEEVIRTHQVAPALGTISCACILLGLRAITWYCSRDCAYEKRTTFTGIDFALDVAARMDSSQLYARFSQTVVK